MSQDDSEDGSVGDGAAVDEPHSHDELDPHLPAADLHLVNPAADLHLDNAANPLNQVAQEAEAPVENYSGDDDEETDDEDDDTEDEIEDDEEAGGGPADNPSLSGKDYLPTFLVPKDECIKSSNDFSKFIYEI